MLQLKRLILFTRDVDGLAAFYNSVLGLPIKSAQRGWVVLEAGGCDLAIHKGSGGSGKAAPKLAFWVEDVPAMRETLIARGAEMGPVISGDGLALCDGTDPAGYVFQLSNRP
jgi:hypothetical protein